MSQNRTGPDRSKNLDRCPPLLASDAHSPKVAMKKLGHKSLFKGLGAVSSVDNSVVLVHRPDTDYKALTQIAHVSDIVHAFLVYAEAAHQAVLRQERASGKASG